MNTEATRGAEASAREQSASTPTVKKAKPTKSRTSTKGKAKSGKPAKRKTAGTKSKQPTQARPDSKKEIVLGLLRRKEGVTIAEIAKATSWQNHSIRGFISGTIAKKIGLTVESEKNEAGERTYRIIT